jgi:fatty acid desaturase
MLCIIYKCSVLRTDAASQSSCPRRIIGTHRGVAESEGCMENWRRRLPQLARWLEAPTWLLIFIIYGGWLTLTMYWTRLPVWVVVPGGAWLCAWHMSLQHELIHGHPTRSAWLNAALAAPPLNLWLPFPLYREQHLRHHRAADLTDPLKDPESTYFAPQAWPRASLLRRFSHGACNTLTGRMLLGPLVLPVLFWRHQASKAAFLVQQWWIWLGHLAWVGLILCWVCHACNIPFVAYLAFFVYPGTALSLIRSLAEHRAAERPEDRTAIVETTGLLALLFLNNNPSVPWYDLPSVWRRERIALLAMRGGPVYRGYRHVASLYALRRHHSGPHPFGPSPSTDSAPNSNTALALSCAETVTPG